MRRSFIVEEGPNPSTDFFVAPALAAEGVGAERRGFGEPPEPAALEGARVVFVRYVPAAWRRRVVEHRARLAGLAYFMDDDLLDAGAARGQPLRYRMKLFALATRHRGWLRRMGAELWVSSPWLAQRYADWRPRLLAPEMPHDMARPAPTVVFYHGSASHRAEARWLAPVMAEVLAAREDLVFELIADPAMRWLYRDLPRVHALHPMKWPAYRALLARGGRGVGLAPLLERPFNRARAATKLHDITAAGAAGIYADHPAYRDAVTHDGNGLLLPMDPAAWVAAIQSLLDDPARRARLHGAALRSLGA
jgi:hypothetical protein